MTDFCPTVEKKIWKMPDFCPTLEIKFKKMPDFCPTIEKNSKNALLLPVSRKKKLKNARHLPDNRKKIWKNARLLPDSRLKISSKIEKMPDFCPTFFYRRRPAPVSKVGHRFLLKKCPTFARARVGHCPTGAGARPGHNQTKIQASICKVLCAIIVAAADATEKQVCHAGDCWKSEPYKHSHGPTTLPDEGREIRPGRTDKSQWPTRYSGKNGLRATNFYYWYYSSGVILHRTDSRRPAKTPKCG